MKKQIPNILTLFNLLSGIIACIFAVKGLLIESAFFVFLGVFFDFFDGFAARLLKVQGELGKQLDSLADVVTSGVAPALVMYQMLKSKSELSRVLVYKNEEWELLPLIGLLLALAAAYRLANFNIDTRQSNSFIGLPTPAMALVVLSIPLIIEYGQYNWAIQLVENPLFLIGITFLLVYLMNANISLFSLKFKDFSWKNNRYRFAFILISLFLLLFFAVIAVPVIVFLYVIMSVFLGSSVKS